LTQLLGLQTVDFQRSKAGRKLPLSLAIHSQGAAAVRD
jgi:hypothetical protein